MPLQVRVTSLAKGYCESCALRLHALPALLCLRCSATFCVSLQQLRPKGRAKSRVVWSMLTNEQLTSIDQGPPATSAEPPNVSGGWQNLKDFP
jgi:hypothetical protein